MPRAYSTLATRKREVVARNDGIPREAANEPARRKAKVAAGGRCAEPEVSCDACRGACGVRVKQTCCKQIPNSLQAIRKPPPLQRSFNGFAIPLAKCGGKTLFSQNHSSPKKHPNCGESMPEFPARYSAQCVAMPLRRSFFAMRLSRLPMMLTNGQFSRPLCLRNQVERGREDRRSQVEFCGNAPQK